VTVAVVDTGIEDDHPDLAGRVVKYVNFEPAWFFDMINDGVFSDQVAEGTGNPVDSYGHGTHVAGIVAGTGAAAGNEVDMSGVAPRARLVNIKIADVHEGVDCSVPCDFGWEINALVAYEWVIEHRNAKELGGIDIVTNSWSILEVDSEVEPISLIVQAAYRKGLVNVFAAGNDGPDKNTVALCPNSLEESIHRRGRLQECRLVWQGEDRRVLEPRATGRHRGSRRQRLLDRRPGLRPVAHRRARSSRIARQRLSLHGVQRDVDGDPTHRRHRGAHARGQPEAHTGTGREDPDHDRHRQGEPGLRHVLGLRAGQRAQGRGEGRIGTARSHQEIEPFSWAESAGL
jgi:Subtilase family